MSIRSDTAQATGNPPQTSLTVDGAASAFGAMLDAEEAPPKPVKRAAAPAVAEEPHDDAGSEDLDASILDEDTDGERADANAEDGDAPEGDEYDDHDDVPAELKKFRLRIKDGDEVKAFSLDDLKKGNLRQADYTRKTMELARERETAEQHNAYVMAQRQQVDQILAAGQQLIAAQMPQEPNWTELAQRDPTAYVQTRAQWDQYMGQLNEVTRVRQANAGQAQQEMQQQFQRQLASEFQQLIAKRPELKSPEKRQAMKQQITDFATSVGITPQELSRISDHRQLEVLYMGSQMAKLLTKAANAKADAKPTPVPNRSPGVRTAAPGQPAARSSYQTASIKAQKRLEKTGKLGDAAAAFSHLL